MLETADWDKWCLPSTSSKYRVPLATGEKIRSQSTCNAIIRDHIISSRLQDAYQHDSLETLQSNLSMLYNHKLRWSHIQKTHEDLRARAESNSSVMEIMRWTFQCAQKCGKEEWDPERQDVKPCSRDATHPIALVHHQTPKAYSPLVFVKFVVD